MRRIAVITTSRADYYILKNLLYEINKDNALTLQLIVTGMHLSARHGLTVSEIEADGFRIDRKVDMPIDTGTDTEIVNAISVCLNGMTHALSELRPDVVVLLGDRYELFAPAIASLILRIPVAHIHGGETTRGAFDEAVRHSVTKIASLHFVAAEEYRRRVIQMGEHPDRVFTVGAPGLDSIHRMDLYPKDELKRILSLPLNTITALITFHPVTSEKNAAGKHITSLCDAVKLTRIDAVFTASNADPEGNILNSYIRNFVASAPGRYVFEINLGARLYFSCMKHLDLMIGNSSSGIIEAPEFGMPVVNIGDRQKGRVRAENVIDVEHKTDDIIRGIHKASEESFRNLLKRLHNPYRAQGRASSSYLIKEKLKSIPPSHELLKNQFYDLPTVNDSV
jgi:UDP-hydrolysing UDP-N-acetyl-D-glucosamine 2-epimerase